MVGMDPRQLANWIKCEKNKFVIRIIIIVSKMRETFLEKYNKAFVGLRSCDKVQTERSIFEYANWPKLQK